MPSVLATLVSSRHKRLVASRLVEACLLLVARYSAIINRELVIFLALHSGIKANLEGKVQALLRIR